jgi:hypothetical protein
MARGYLTKLDLVFPTRAGGGGSEDESEGARE